MKLKVLFPAALVAIICSCGKEEALPEPSPAGMTITASWGDSGQKTVIGEDPTTVLWSPNDKISVFYNEDGLRFTSLNSTPAPIATFMCDYGVVFAAAEGTGFPDLYGVYPYSDTNEQVGETLVLDVPDLQTAEDGSFGRGAFPAVGRSSSPDIAFYNVCGGVRFTLTEDGISKIRFSGNSGEDLAGRVKVCFSDSGLPEVSEIVRGEKTVTLSAPDGSTFRKGVWYYISLLPTSLKDGFTFEFIKRADGSERASRNIRANVNVKRSTFGSLRNIDSGVAYKVGIASLPVTPSAMIISPGSSFQLSYSVLPADAEYEWIEWTSSNPDVASVDNAGRVTTHKTGESIISVRSDNGTVGTCDVCATANPVLTLDATGVESTHSTLNGAGDLIGFTSLEKSIYFLYSSTETTLGGLVANGTKIAVTTSGSSFSANVNALSRNTEYHFVAVIEAGGTSFYGTVKSFKTKDLPGGTVNLGLSVYWADCNLGADNPSDCGGYYSWGETKPKTNFAWNNYSLCNGYYNKLKKYVVKSSFGTVDNRKVLESADDAATAVLGRKWRTPTKAEWDELIERCIWTWTKVDGVDGYEVSSPMTGNSIFLPVCGMYVNTSIEDAGRRGFYWSSELSKGFYLLAWGVCMDAYDVTGFYGRCFGRTIRPVFDAD